MCACLVLSAAMKRLILNADDFGLTLGINRAIIRAHREGILTSATLMASGLEFEDACAQGRTNSRLSVGCHIVLVGGKSVSPPSEISSLVREDGLFPKSPWSFAAKVSCGKIRTGDIEREVLAQIAKIRASGIEPSHLDTHKHAHAHPAVLEVIARVAQSCGIRRIRRPVERLHASWNGGGLSRQFAAAAIVRIMARHFDSTARRYGLRAPDHFLGLAMTGQLGPQALRRMIEMLPEGTTEIMVHPGFCDQDLANTGSRLQRQRELELDGLLDADVKHTLKKEDVQLIGYRELD